MWDDSRPKQGAEMATKLQCSGQQIYGQDRFFQLKPFQNLVASYKQSSYSKRNSPGLQREQKQAPVELGKDVRVLKDEDFSEDG